MIDDILYGAYRPALHDSVPYPDLIPEPQYGQSTPAMLR